MADWYQIENSTFIAQFSSDGAEIKRLFAKPWSRELLWVPSDASTKKIWNRTAPVLFPIVGKLKSDQYTFKDKHYSMSQHGFARDRGFKCLTCGTTEISFLLAADQETFKQFPFCFELRIDYKLEDKKLVVSYTVKNDDRQDIYFSIGAHPAFATNVIADYEIQFEKKERGFFRTQNSLVNWQQFYALDADRLRPTAELFSQDALIFKDMESSYVDLVNHKRHETIRLHGGHTPYFGIWAKDSLPFICLEPWYGVSDEAGHDQQLESKKGIQRLGMGGEFRFSYEIELLV